MQKRDSFRTRLQKQNSHFHAVFLELVNDISPLLESVKELFPEFTRHDPSHIMKLEEIAFEILKPEARKALADVEVFTLLCSLWIHDAGLGVNTLVENIYKEKPEFKEKLNQFKRVGQSEGDCWACFVRENHHKFCKHISEQFLKNKIGKGIISWIGEIAESHCKRDIHDREKWPKSVAVDNNLRINPSALAAVLRISDILHFNSDRAPEYMLEHREIQNQVSLRHWKAHQISYDYVIQDNVCFFDGATEDDEAYWFAHQFTDAMEDELTYCQSLVLQTLDHPFREAFSFSRVVNRIKHVNFIADKTALTLQVKTSKMLDDLLSSSLYSNKPVWFRELLQNAFDACRDRSALDQYSRPHVIISVDTTEETITFHDTGIGMQKSTVENFLLIAGASYWISDEYKASTDHKVGHVGKFGIGFMSVLSVAEKVEVVTRHFCSLNGYKFIIRNANRIVRVEDFIKEEAGTYIKIKFKRSLLFQNDILDLFDKTCSWPEFPIKLVIDDEAHRELKESRSLNLSTNEIKLEKISDTADDVKLLEKEISDPGLQGVFLVPKVFLKSLNEYVPIDAPSVRWIQSAGWSFDTESKIYFGGVNYQKLHSLQNMWGFSSIPSFGSLRLQVSPNEYPLEMNLARDEYITGPATKKLFKNICSFLDNVLSEDIRSIIKNRSDKLIRSAIVARYSSAIMDIWVGNVPNLTLIGTASWSIPAQKIDASPWPQLTKLAMEELQFKCLDKAQNSGYYTIGDFINQKAIVFAAGFKETEISENLLASIFQFDPSAKILVSLPSSTFGLFKLKHWAKQEFLVPVHAHNRCAYGLSFGEYLAPFEFFTSEIDHLGIPVCSGPKAFSIIDYREFMYEVENNPMGGPNITGVLNRCNEKNKFLLNALSRFKDRSDVFKFRKLNLEKLRADLSLGMQGRYKIDNRKRLAQMLNRIILLLQEAEMMGNKSLQYSEHDFPEYFDGSTVESFGYCKTHELTLHSDIESESYDKGF